VGIGLSRLGASRAVAVGAYAFALDALDLDDDADGRAMAAR
jgi:hypothetical protein